jgi:hypothetical protein
MCDHVYTEREYVTPLFENPLTVLSICAETFYHEAIKRFPTGNYGEWLADWFEGTASVCYFTAQDLMHIICIAVVLSIVRYILNITVFKKIPLWLKMGPDSASKFPESCSSTIIYSVSWFWALFIVLTNPKNIFLDLSTHWRSECACSLSSCTAVHVGIVYSALLTFNHILNGAPSFMGP